MQRVHRTHLLHFLQGAPSDEVRAEPHLVGDFEVFVHLGLVHVKVDERYFLPSLCQNRRQVGGDE